MKIPIKILGERDGFALPQYQTSGSSGMDLVSTEDLTLNPGQRALVKCGFAMVIPHGYEAQVRPRSGLALKHGITVLNTPGTIDSDYRGEVGVILINLGQESYELKKGERMAQMIFCKVDCVEWEIVDSLEDSERGAGGFGHTGHSS